MTKNTTNSKQSSDLITQTGISIVNSGNSSLDSHALLLRAGAESPDDGVVSPSSHEEIAKTGKEEQGACSSDIPVVTVDTSSSVDLPADFQRKSNRKLKPTKNKRRYLTCPDGKRRWVRIVLAGVRGPDKKRLSPSGNKHGPEHALYIHGAGKSRPYNPKLHEAWKVGVLTAGNFRCLVTGETINLTCHHLNSWDWCEEGRYDISNGVALSDEIHRKFHSIYGSGRNTRAQFEHFLRTYYNIDINTALNNGQHGNHEPSLTIEIVSKTLEIKEKQKQAGLMDLMNARNHELVSGSYVNAASKIVVRCKIHDKVHETTVTNYKKSRTGMPCCGKQRQSEATAYHNTLR